MALDPIWKQQLTLVTYGNEFLQQRLSLSEWRTHPIFNQHSLQFRDLRNQHLLAQHFQVWLEGLQKQGTTKLSLHLSHLLSEEQNPNGNIELLPFAHFIASHTPEKKTAWICGHELAEWYPYDNEFIAPEQQHIVLRQETLWRYDINEKLSKKIEADLKTANWSEISDYMEQQLFLPAVEYGFNEKTDPDSSAFDETPHHSNQALLPARFPAPIAHRLMQKNDQLCRYLEEKRQHPYSDLGETFSPEAQTELRNFSLKAEDLFAKLIVKTANHYQTAEESKEIDDEPYDRTMESVAPKGGEHHHVGSSAVIKLVIIVLMICAAAYYFGL